MLEVTGIVNKEDLEKIIPSPLRMQNGPVAIIECFQKIPCNPCWEACIRGAIAPLEDMNDLPKVDFDKCNGCGVCSLRCPGLAIFIIDCSYSDKEAVVRLPYEYYPLPEKGQTVVGYNRAGEKLGCFKVHKVQQGGKQEKTALIWLIVPQELCMEVRHVSVERVGDNGR